MQPQARDYGAVNWLGLWTLYVREVRRFMKVHFQTVGAPVAMALLFLAIFTLALGRAVETVKGVEFVTFLAPGLMMMMMIQNSFANTSSSIMIAKIQGNIVDMLMPPLSPGELTLALVGGGVTRGLIVGVAVGVVMALVVPVTVAAPWAILYFAVSANVMLSLIGLLAGVWAEKFDHMAAVTNFVITPLSFLSGTFYSIDRLDGAFRLLAWLNPFFYNIDGFRGGFIGTSDADPLVGVVVTLAANVALAVLTYTVIRRGYKLKS